MEEHPHVLRDSVKSFLISAIHSGQLQCGSSLNLAALSRHLRVSVTPIREALSQLEQSRIIQAVPNRGFIVHELSLKECKGLFQTIAELEVVALENSTFDAFLFGQLKKGQLHLQQSHTPSNRLKARIHFHHLLTKNCGNAILLGIIKDLEARVLFYEQMFITKASFYEQLDNQNEAILQAIEDNNLPTAALVLKMNWMALLEYIQKQLIRLEPVDFEVVV